MKLVSRRLRRLEDRLGPAVETEFTRRLRARIEEGLRRVAAARGDQQQCQLEGGQMPESQRQRLREMVGFRATPNSFR